MNRGPRVVGPQKFFRQDFMCCHRQVSEQGDWETDVEPNSSHIITMDALPDASCGK